MKHRCDEANSDGLVDNGCWRIFIVIILVQPHLTSTTSRIEVLQVDHFDAAVVWAIVHDSTAPSCGPIV